MTAKRKILVTQDEPGMVRLIESNLKRAGFVVRQVSRGDEVAARVRTWKPDLLLLDVMLPGRSGFEVCRELKSDLQIRQMPIVLLTAKALEQDRVQGLELGADDYVTKPFSPRELVLRVQARLRKFPPNEGAGEVVQVGEIKIDRSEPAAEVAGRRLALTATEFKLLLVLMERVGRVQTRERLLSGRLGLQGGDRIAHRRYLRHSPARETRPRRRASRDCAWIRLPVRGHAAVEMSDDALLRAALAVLDDGVILVDAAGRIEFANATLREWFGLTTEICGKPLRTIFHDAALADLAEASKLESIELRADRAGQTRWLEARARRLEEGRLSPTLLLFRDITAQRTLHAAGAEMVANVSHELRTPVSILAGYIENLVDFPKMRRAEQVEICGIMQEHAHRLKSLLDDLLTLASFDSRNEVLAFAPLDLGDFLRRLAKDWQTPLAAKEMAFILELGEGAETIVVDRFRFEQVMHNLIDNAFKYTPIEGQIRVRAAAVGEQIEISVEDNGAGIPQEDLPHVFERFYRVDKARSRKYGGTGLGLAIVKHIVALHGGSVRAESVIQMSTRVTISFPRR